MSKCKHTLYLRQKTHETLCLRGNNALADRHPNTNILWTFKYEYPMDIQKLAINRRPKSDVRWTSISCPWTCGRKMDLKRMSIGCPVLSGDGIKLGI